MRIATISRLNALGLLAASAIALASCASGSADPRQEALDSLYGVGQNDAFGARQDAASLRAAAQPAAGPLTARQQNTLDREYSVGQNTDFGANHTDDAVLAQRDDAARLAATVPMVAGKRDVVGDGGAQDALAHEMYPLGTSINDFGGRN